MTTPDSEQIARFNEKASGNHQRRIENLKEELTSKGFSWEDMLSKVSDLQVAVPSWALGAGGTRFGRFNIGGSPRSLLEKIEDISLLSRLTRHTNTVSLHIPWDLPEDPEEVRSYASDRNIRFDAMNSNTFQDYGQPLSYKYGSLAHMNPDVRQQAVEHNVEVINIGKKLGSKGLTVWLADGTNFPGQASFRKQYNNTRESLRKIYQALPDDWKLLLEYKPYEPNFYSTVIPDWGTSQALCHALGDRAKVLVDLGHHLPNTNIEQVVATLINHKMLAGFHFNDSKYGDDDLTAGSIRPYQLFLIFCELIAGAEEGCQSWESISWMIDASHNTKDPVEDLMQSLDAIVTYYTKALLVNRKELAHCQESGDAVRAQEILREAFHTDVRPLVREARMISGGAIDPIGIFREYRIRENLTRERGNSQSTGL